MRRKIMLILFALQAFIFNLTNVVTPTYLKGLGLDNVYFGYFFGIWSLGMLISSPIWGNLGDKYGRKLFVVLGLCIYAVSQLVFYFTDSIPILILFRFISGIGIGAPVTLLLSHMISETRRINTATFLSHRMAFLTIGITISYKISGVLGAFYVTELFLIQSILTVVYIVLIIIFMKENNHKQCVIPRQLSLIESIKKLKLVDKENILFLFTITLATITFVNIDKFIDLYVIDQGYDSITLGNLKMVVGIITILTNFLIIPRVKKYLNNVLIMQSFQIVMAIIILIVFNDSRIILMLYTLFMLFVILKSIYTTSEQLYLSKKVSRKDMGLFMGIRQSFACLGMVIGPIIGGHIYQSGSGNLFVFCVICLLLSSIILSYIQGNEYTLEKKKELIQSR